MNGVSGKVIAVMAALVVMLAGIVALVATHATSDVTSAVVGFIVVLVPMIFGYLSLTSKVTSAQKSNEEAIEANTLVTKGIAKRVNGSLDAAFKTVHDKIDEVAAQGTIEHDALHARIDAVTPKAPVPVKARKTTKAKVIRKGIN